MESTGPFQPWANDENSKDVKSEAELADDAKLHREDVNHPKHRQTASYNKESVSDSTNAPGSSSDTGPGGATEGTEPEMDSNKITSMQQIVENTLSQEGRQRVTHLIEAVEALSGAEKLLLYLRLPTGVPPHDPLKQPINPLGSRAELKQTVTWIQTHLEVDPDVSLPKQDVYDEYIAHCMSSNMKPLSTADFGKVMKQVYPSVRPRRLGTRGNSRYCYAGLRKRIKLEVPQLPDLGESSKEPIVTSRENERIVCDWAETKLGVKFANILELSQHLLSPAPNLTTPGPLSTSPQPAVPQPHGSATADDATSRQLIKHLKRKMQGHGTPGRPKKNKGQELTGESSPAASGTCVGHHPTLKHETEQVPETSYAYQPAYVTVYEPRPPYSAYGAPPRAHPLPALTTHEYRPDPYAFEPTYAPHDLTLPINLSSNASLDLSTDRADWHRRRPPEPPPPPRLPLPGKKFILETYQIETAARAPPLQPVSAPTPDDFPRAEYLPKKMRAAEILGGKLAAARHVVAVSEAGSSSAPVAEPAPLRPAGAFLEDPKNLTSRSKSTAAALAREEQEAASPTRSTRALASIKPRKINSRMRSNSPDRARSPERPATPDSCCGLDGINIRTGVICEEKHSEILNRERVISICNIDKHDLDDYLNEGNSQEHEEELLQYFHQQRAAQAEAAAELDQSERTVIFLEASQDPQDEHSQGKNEKISQLRELLAKNLKNQSGSNSQNAINQNADQSQANTNQQQSAKVSDCGDAFKPLNVDESDMNGTATTKAVEVNPPKQCHSVPHQNGSTLPFNNDKTSNQMIPNVSGSHLYNGHCQNEPQSPTTRTQQYDFVPISEGCHSPGHFRGQSPTKVQKQVIVGGSLQTSPTSHSTAASPFVSPRNTPVPRSRLCPRPIPKHNGRKRRNPLTLGINDMCSKPFAIPNDQKFITKNTTCDPGKYCQPMSAPPSPNILSSHFKSQLYQCNSSIQNGNNNNLCLNFLPNNAFREHINGDPPLSADPLSSEVSQFFQDSMVTYRPGPDAFRSQSVPLKHGINNIGLLSYNNTPVGSVPPTPVPNEFCDFGSLAETCDISRAGLNRETLDKIYNAIDSSHDVLNPDGTANLLNTNDGLSNGCDSMPGSQMLPDQLTSLIPGGEELLDSGNQFNQSYTNDSSTTENTNSIDLDLSELVTDKSKYYTSRSVPSTPLPYKRAAPGLQIDSRRSRDLFAVENYTIPTNGICSKSVPSTPQFAEDRSVFSYSNRDFLINGNSVCGSTQVHETVVENDQTLASPLHDMLREDILDPLTPALLADLDKIDAAPYVDL